MIQDELEYRLADLERDGLRRRRRVLELPCGPLARVDGRELISFGSNDYLGLASDPALIEAACAGARRWGVGSGASHLLSGHLLPHQTLEERLAAFTGFDRALLFSTGYLANLGIVASLVGRGDAVFADRLNHASLIDAVLLSRAEHARYPHGDVEALERQLAASPAKRKLILTDAVFSMDGDLAPLPQLLRLAERFDAWLVLDDAHGFGVLGKEGRGTLSHFDLPADPRLVYMGTLGKAAGASGAFVAGSATLIEWLLQRARTYVFTTGASPIIACALLASLERIQSGDERRRHLRRLADHLRDGLSDSRWKLISSPTAIQPIIIGDNDEALRVAQALLDRGLWVPAIRPPTVPKGTARLRVSLSAAHDEAHVRRLVEALSEDGLQKTKAGEDRRQIGSRRFAPGDDEKPDARFFLPPSARSAQTDPSPVFPNLCLLIHGWGMDRRIWSPCLAALGNVAETRFVDLPGYGEAPDHGLDFAGTARFLADSLPAGAILCGWSLGALLAMQAALLSPRRVGGLILVGGTPCFIRRNGWTTAQSPAMLKKFSADVSDDSRTALRRFAALFNQGDATARLTARAAVQGILSAPPASATLLAGLDWLRDADLRERVPEIGCPTLLIHGERDPLMPLAAARWLAEKLPRARLDVFAGAAHAPFLNDPERFARLVGGFLHDIRTDQAARS